MISRQPISAGVLGSSALHLAALAVVGLTLIAVGQPLFTEDMWWHLSMGRAYAANGPWLSLDPNLFTAAAPPSPAAWLSSLSLYGAERVFGFQGLRLVHVFLASLVLWLAWSSLVRVSGSRAYASAATAIFATLSAYRLFQLRPDLITLLGALLLVRLLVIPDLGIPGTALANKKKIVAGVVAMGLWANAHAGFLLGPVLLAAAIGALLISRASGTLSRSGEGSRTRLLAVALAAGLLATLLNPTGAAPHLLYFSAGTATPDLSVVADEWQRIDLFALPPPNLPPSLLTWLVVWCLFVTTSIAAVLVLRKLRGGRAVSGPIAEEFDPALLGVAAVSAAAMLAAVRFLWAGIFLLLLLGACLRVLGVFRTAPRPVHLFGSAIFAVALVCGFVAHGAWPMISKAVRWDAYAQPYTTAKNDAHAVWFMADTKLEGNLFNDYSSGNFLGYWLAPRLRTFINGSLNVPIEVMNASFTIGRRAGEADESFESLLDRYSIDVFFATGTPRLSLPNRPRISTTTHLEGTPGWLLVFRSISTAIYLRNNERNRENLARVEAYYAQQQVPFDVGAGGLDVAQVVRNAPRWATEHGLLPVDLPELEAATRVADPSQRLAASERLAGLLAVAGLYSQAEAIDREVLRMNPREVRAARRLVWCLLHQQRFEQARTLARHLTTIAAPGDPISNMLVNTSNQLPALSEGQRAAVIAAIPMMSRLQARQIGAGFVQPEIR